MIEGICHVIAFICGLIPVSVWLAVILVGTVACVIAGEGVFTFLRLVVMVFVAFWLLYFVGWLLPAWLETVLVLGAILGIVLISK